MNAKRLIILFGASLLLRPILLLGLGLLGPPKTENNNTNGGRDGEGSTNDHGTPTASTTPGNGRAGRVPGIDANFALREEFDDSITTGACTSSGSTSASRESSSSSASTSSSISTSSGSSTSVSTITSSTIVDVISSSPLSAGSLLPGPVGSHGARARLADGYGVTDLRTALFGLGLETQTLEWNDGADHNGSAIRSCAASDCDDDYLEGTDEAFFTANAPRVTSESTFFEESEKGDSNAENKAEQLPSSFTTYPAKIAVFSDDLASATSAAAPAAAAASSAVGAASDSNDGINGITDGRISGNGGASGKPDGATEVDTSTQECWRCLQDGFEYHLVTQGGIGFCIPGDLFDPFERKQAPVRVCEAPTEHNPYRRFSSRPIDEEMADDTAAAVDEESPAPAKESTDLDADADATSSTAADGDGTGGLVFKSDLRLVRKLRKDEKFVAGVFAAAGAGGMPSLRMFEAGKETTGASEAKRYLPLAAGTLVGPSYAADRFVVKAGKRIWVFRARDPAHLDSWVAAIKSVLSAGRADPDDGISDGTDSDADSDADSDGNSGSGGGGGCALCDPDEMNPGAAKPILGPWAVYERSLFKGWTRRELVLVWEAAGAVLKLSGVTRGQATRSKLSWHFDPRSGNEGGPCLGAFRAR